MNVSYLFLAPGFEEIEAIAVVDILRRGGVDVRTVSVGGGNEVTGAHPGYYPCGCVIETNSAGRG